MYLIIPSTDHAIPWLACIVWHMTFSFFGMSSLFLQRCAFCQLLQNDLQSPVIPVPPPICFHGSCLLPQLSFLPLFCSPVCSFSTRSFSLPQGLYTCSFLCLECSLPTPFPRYSAMTSSFLTLVSSQILPSQRSSTLTSLKIASTCTKTHTQQALPHPLPYSEFSKVLKTTWTYIIYLYFLVPLEYKAPKQQRTHSLFSVIFPGHS